MKNREYTQTEGGAVEKHRGEMNRTEKPTKSFTINEIKQTIFQRIREKTN